MGKHIDPAEIIPCGPSKDKRFQNLWGRTFRRLLVVELIGRTRKGRAYVWKCLCSCGDYTTARSGDLTSGDTKSCGCLKSETAGSINRTHSLGHTLIYQTWWRMLNRCRNPLSQDWKHYGCRGISVCERWQTFEHFLADMGEKPTPKHSIERIDNNGNYEPSNCRWATPHQQQMNKRNNVRVTFKGETMCASELARRLGLKTYTVLSRLRRGYSLEDALTASRLRRRTAHQSRSRCQAKSQLP